jgi:hypothetical protein
MEIQTTGFNPMYKLSLKITKMTVAVSIVTALVTSVTQGRANAVSFTDVPSGITYDITTVTGTYDDFINPASPKNFTKNFWWGGGSTKARAVATAVGSALGLPNNGYNSPNSNLPRNLSVGPWFAYNWNLNPSSLNYFDAIFYIPTVSDLGSDSLYFRLFATTAPTDQTGITWAIATPISVPEPDGIGGMLAMMAVGVGIVAKRRFTLAHDKNAES